MDATAKRRLIALKSPQSTRSDGRPRCEDCGRVLVQRDFLSYWDGQEEIMHAEARKTCTRLDEIDAYMIPRCCENCSELVYECKSV